MDVFAGPPFVRFTDSSNSCNVPLVDMIAVNRIVGFNSGTVKFRVLNVKETVRKDEAETLYEILP